MDAILDTSFSCTYCKRTHPVRISHPDIRRVSMLSEAIQVAEPLLDATGWAFLVGEVERRNGDVEVLAGLWCPACAARFRAYLASRGAS
jgi:hypothetical protein